MTFWVYLLECADGKLYTGHSEDLERRLGEHREGRHGFTSVRRPVQLLYLMDFPTRAEALQAELQIKGWSRRKKLAMVKGDWDLVSTLARRRTK